jgi:hypothetical protein
MKTFSHTQMKAWNHAMLEMKLKSTNQKCAELQVGAFFGDDHPVQR